MPGSRTSSGYRGDVGRHHLAGVDSTAEEAKGDSRYGRSVAERASFEVGDRVRVTGGYDMEPEWLQGDDGYAGTIIEVHGDWAAVELDRELQLSASDQSEGWADFGSGAARQTGVLRVARGRWLALAQAWEGGEWREPIGRVHVSLCSERPNLPAIPKGGGVGAWVESHGTMLRASDD
jgi:hypothetical protein